TGLGPVSPGMLQNDVLSPIASEDIFFITLLSSYGVILPVLLGSAVLIAFTAAIAAARRTANMRLQALLAGRLRCLVAYLVSTVHTNAMMWPQLFPLFFLFLAVVAVARRSTSRRFAP